MELDILRIDLCSSHLKLDMDILEMEFIRPINFIQHVISSSSGNLISQFKTFLFLDKKLWLKSAIFSYSMANEPEK